MLTKFALFNGTVKAGREAEMREFIDQHLKPLWQQFQPSERVQVLYGVQQDPDGPVIPLVLAVTYRDHAAMEQAMASEARHKAREMLPELYQRFFNDVTLWHYVFEDDN